MKVLAALPCVFAAVDDTSTLLSVKFQTHLETGVDSLLDAVGKRNVTQMSSLLQNIVEETISEGPYQMDGDVTAALEVIKAELLMDIRSALNEAHCHDQSELHTQILCFEDCELQKDTALAGCPDHCSGLAHKQCRQVLVEKYKFHISECRALDDFMRDFEADCPKAEKKCCLLGHTTWNCGGLCSSQIADFEVDGYFGEWLTLQITKFEAAYNEWMSLHHKCTVAYKAYVELDASCDCKQAECETINCQHETCNYLACNDVYNSCWARCEVNYHEVNKAKECLEKDRKIDWSATEKIECYVDVLLAKPTKDELLAKCGAEDCYSKYREQMYKECNLICPEVDFDTAWGEHLRREDDQDVTDEGASYVRTRHRAADGSDAIVRCTAHLDLDYQIPPCCHPCKTRPEPPCTETSEWGKEVTYMWIHYHQWGFLDQTPVEDMDAEICHYGEHTKAYAYNLCDCIDCPKMTKCDEPTCTGDKRCSAGPYDYRRHDIKVDCNAISDSENPDPYPTTAPGECVTGEIMTTAPALSGGCQRCTCAGGQWQCACSMRHRKEINDLSDAEFSKFAAALNALKADGTWANISMVHQMADSQMHPGGMPHGSPIFLPWHRKYFVEVENRLQMAVNDCSVTIPYWNWALELPDFANSRVFASNRMGALNHANAPGMCVQDGAFGTQTAGSSFTGTGANELGTAGTSLGATTDCIMRGGSAPSGENYATILSALSQPSLGINEFVQMSNYVERDLHNFFHGAVGGWAVSGNSWVIGHMDSFVSPYDPMFFMHHGFIDFLWSKWQGVHVDETDRLHRQDDLMYELLWDGHQNVFPVSDIAMNLDILDDNHDTPDVVEKACVVYHERHHGDNACGANWAHIQSCLTTVVQAERLHEVPRIKESTSVGDVCSAINPIQADFDRRWLENMVAMGMMESHRVEEILQWESTFNADIEARTPTLDEADASACDKKLCFSTEKLFSICAEITQR
jgi:tyrosinase